MISTHWNNITPRADNDNKVKFIFNMGATSIDVSRALRVYPKGHQFLATLENVGFSYCDENGTCSMNSPATTGDTRRTAIQNLEKYLTDIDQEFGLNMQSISLIEAPKFKIVNS